MQKDKELVCAEYGKLNRNSVCLETRYDVLVEQLKDELCGVNFMNQEEDYLEVECI